MQSIFFDDWGALARTVIIAVVAYPSLIAFLRVSGKRTLAKLNAFDLVVTVALGSTLASLLLSKDVALVQGLLGFALLIGLQFAITWTSIRVRWIRGVVTGEPTLLVYGGEWLPAALKRERMTQDEVRAAVRSAGLAAIGDAQAVVLETDGSLSVVEKDAGGRTSSLDGLTRPG